MSTVTKKFVNPAQIESAISEVNRLAEAEGVHVALAGGAAMQLYGSDRLTKDVDFVASGNIAALEPKGALMRGGYAAITSEAVPVDIMIRDDEYRDLYERALLEAKFDAEIGSFVVGPEYLAAMKFQAKRAKDMEDLRHLLLREGADIEAIRKVFREFFGRYVARDELDAMIAEFRWLASQGR